MTPSIFVDRIVVGRREYTMPKARLTREQIAERAALELPDGAYVNLGWGIPNLIAAYVPTDVMVYFHSENGILGMGPRAKAGEEDFDLVDAMKVPVTLVPGAAYFSQVDAHVMTRGGHLDICILGGLQVSEKRRFRELAGARSEGRGRDRRRDGYFCGRAEIDRDDGAHCQGWFAENREDVQLSADRD